MVAFLFRTLDAWRIFDNPFVMTGGAEQHRDHLVPRLPAERDTGEPRAWIGGFGSAVPVGGADRLVFIKVFKTDLSARCGATNDLPKSNRWWTIAGARHRRLWASSRCCG